MMGFQRFTRPKGVDGDSSPNLYVANCGPAVGLSLDSITSVFSKFGEVKGVYPADDSGTRVIVSYNKNSSAESALQALDGHQCSDLQSRTLHVRYSVHQVISKVKANPVQVSLEASDLNIPGLYLVHEFVSAKEEEDLLAAVDACPWDSLAKRRVQHFGYAFCYKTRNVDTKQHLGALPSFITPVLDKIPFCEKFGDVADITVDQLTINEYPAGVGLSPHIDTHSAFEDSIFSLSLAGPCIMEFRKYLEGDWRPACPGDREVENCESSSSILRRAIYLPPRSMLLISGEARYAWHHYIPHHKVDMVNDAVIRRASRRVSFTFRKVRKGPCQCEFPQYCDSER